MHVEQAVFSSGRRRQREGFHLVGRSSGLTKADAQLLVRQLPWCDALSPSDREPTGTCYANLGDDAICISRTIRLSGGPVSRGLGGFETPQLLTHCLLVPRETFERFANNPFAILRAVAASGYVLSHEPPAGKLQPIRLAGRAPAVDHILLGNLSRYPGSATLAGLVHEAVGRERLILVARRAEELLSGLMNVLPVDERAQFSFSVGLRPSLRRPVRIVAVPETNLQIERFARQCRCKVVQLSELAKVNYHGNAWASLVEDALEAARFSWLAEQVRAPHFDGVGEDAAAVDNRAQRLGHSWAANCSATSTRISSAARAAGGSSSVAVLEPPHADASRATAARSDASEAQSDSSAATELETDRAEESTKDATGAARDRDMAALHHDKAGDDPQSLEMLERLDDLVYDAIAGRPGAFDELTRFWPEAQARLEGEALVESREQYLRYALGLWNHGDTAGIADPQRAMGALDVLCLLFPAGEF